MHRDNGLPFGAMSGIEVFADPVLDFCALVEDLPKKSRTELDSNVVTVDSSIPIVVEGLLLD
jgi:hypothetical protein